MKTVVTLTGPSASGKTILEARLTETGLFDRIVSHTTRTPRAGEIESGAYQFVSPELMMAMRARGDFVESAQYGKNWYGSSKAEFERIFAAGKMVMAVVEPQGRDNLREAGRRNGWNVISVFVDCPVDLQANRLVNRMFEQLSKPGADQTAPVEELKKRMIQAIEVEPAWRTEARARPQLHEIYIPVSDAGNMDATMDLILERCGRPRQASLLEAEPAPAPGKPASGPFKAERFASNGYEVSSKGDRRFSAFYARLDDGRTIEAAYQLDIKGYRIHGNDPMLGKSKDSLRGHTHEQLWEEYLGLWRQWARENPQLMDELADKAAGKVLTDMFAKTPISQARALAQILNERLAAAAQADVDEPRERTRMACRMR